jgi:hypothetical protein
MNMDENKVLMKSSEDYVSIEQTPDGRYLVYYPMDYPWGIEHRFAEMPMEDVQMILDGKRPIGDIGFKAKYGSWPFTKEENEKYYQEHGINEKLAKIKQWQIDERKIKEAQNNER